MPEPDDPPRVLVLGAGPTGLAAAILLGRRGVRTVVVDRWPDVYDRPRAVHLDDEVYRILTDLGVARRFAAISRPARGLRLVTADGRVLAEFPRQDDAGRHGFPQANMFDQPQLEQLLRDELATLPEVTLRLGVEVTGFRPGADGVRVDLLDPATGGTEVLTAEYLLGCDGAYSLVRAGIGSRMEDLRFEQRWLVVDVATDAELGLWDGVHQVCDTNRPATYMRVGARRHRFEFRLRDDEGPSTYPDLAAVRPLLAPWLSGDDGRPDSEPGPEPDSELDSEPAPDPLTDLELVRLAVYTFRARLADRWRSGRVFLLGDAAHLTPPFVGQGVGAGLRDAANLAWKVAGVLDGSLPEAVLDSYETERRPHARSMIRLARLVGRLMTAGGRAGDSARRLVAPRLHRVPSLRSKALDSTTPVLRRSRLVRPTGFGAGSFRPRLAGSLCPNVVTSGGHRFDDAVGAAFAVVTVGEPSAAERDAILCRGAVPVSCEPDSELGAWLRRGRVRAAVVRPDRVVMQAGRDLTALLEVVPVAAGGGMGVFSSPGGRCSRRPGSRARSPARFSDRVRSNASGIIPSPIIARMPPAATDVIAASTDGETPAG